MRRRRKASLLRKRMISTGRRRAYNRKHPADAGRLKFGKGEVGSLMKDAPPQYRAAMERALRSRGGRKALKAYRKFWGIPLPPRLVSVGPSTKGPLKILVGMGRVPEIKVTKTLSPSAEEVRRIKGGRAGSGDKLFIRGVNRKGRLSGTKTIKGPWKGMFTPDGRQILLVKKRLSGNPRWKRIGNVVETHYIPTGEMEKAGTFKKGKYWVHQHHDEGGKWPAAYQDQNGNVKYAKGTYHITDWIRR